MTINVSINGENHEVDVEPDTPLLWVIRDALGMTGTKFGCGIMQCGACTVHVDGVATRSCMYPISELGAKEVTTIEGLSEDVSHPLQRAWIEADVPQCGYCQSGMIMAAASLLKVTPEPTDEEIDQQITNICRCGTYTRVRQAIHDAAKSSQS